MHHIPSRHGARAPGRSKPAPVKKAAGIALMSVALFFSLIAAISGASDAISGFIFLDLICFIPGAFLYYRAYNPKVKVLNQVPPVDPSLPLPEVPAEGLILKSGEACHLAIPVQSAKSKQITAGYTGRRAGMSVRVAKGVILHSGGSKSTPIHRTVLQKWPGTLYVTNQRIVLNASHCGFNKQITSLDSYQLYKGGVSLQFGSSSYLVLTKSPEYVVSVIKAEMAQRNGLSTSSPSILSDGGVLHE